MIINYFINLKLKNLYLILTILFKKLKILYLIKLISIYQLIKLKYEKIS